MFNVMVLASDNGWEEGAFVWSRSRMFEYTEDEIRTRFETLDERALEQLAELPTLFMYERGVEGVPRVGVIKGIQKRGGEVRIVFEFNNDVVSLDEGAIEGLKWELGLADFEFTRVHWAVKKGNLLEILRTKGYIRTSHETRPC